MKAAESVSLPAGAGYSLPLQWFAAESPTATVVMMAALAGCLKAPCVLSVA